MKIYGMVILLGLLIGCVDCVNHLHGHQDYLVYDSDGHITTYTKCLRKE